MTVRAATACWPTTTVHMQFCSGENLQDHLADSTDISPSGITIFVHIFIYSFTNHINIHARQL